MSSGVPSEEYTAFRGAGQQPRRADAETDDPGAGRRSDDDGSLEPEEEFLRLDAARVADHRAVRAEDAVARDDDRKRVLPGGPADGLEALRRRNLAGDVLVGGGDPVRDPCELFPDAQLERRA